VKVTMHFDILEN